MKDALFSCVLSLLANKAEKVCQGKQSSLFGFFMSNNTNYLRKVDYLCKCYLAFFITGRIG
jgi:hypothetical protein